MAAAQPSPADELRPVFEKIKISELTGTPLGKVETLRSDMKIRDAIQFLHDKGILSAPVVDVKHADEKDWKTKYLGVVDMVKMVMVMQTALMADSAIHEEPEDLDEAAGELVKKALHFHPLSSNFADRPLSEMTESEAGWFPFMPIEEDSSLMDAIVLLGTFKLKRLPVIRSGADGDLVNMVTQSSIVDMLARQVDHLKPITDKSLEELGLAEPKNVLTIRASQPVKEAFKLIGEHGVSAVPVLGVSGEMVGNISARHSYFVITARNKLRVLNMKASAFLAWANDQESSWNIKNTAIVCKPADSLGSVLIKLAAARIHRIYLCDEQRRPYRVIALCDILQQFGASASEQVCTLL